MALKISVTEAKAQLTELVRRAEAGEEILLTRHGRVVVRLTPVLPHVSAAKRRALLAEIIAEARQAPTPGPSAARSQDFLYDSDGLPR